MLHSANKMIFHLYGIRNCQTVKKARDWLEEHNVVYQFHDYRTEGVTEEQLTEFIDQLGWEAVLNKNSTTWRNLDETLRAEVTHSTAAKALMREHVALIKRPLLVSPKGKCDLGFSPEIYQRLTREVE